MQVKAMGHCGLVALHAVLQFAAPGLALSEHSMRVMNCCEPRRRQRLRLAGAKRQLVADRILQVLDLRTGGGEGGNKSRQLRQQLCICPEEQNGGGMFFQERG